MARTELPWIIFNRRIHPYALAVSLASFTVGYNLLVTRNGTGDILNGSLHGFTVGVFALLSSLFLWLGFWFKKSHLMHTGLLLSAGVFTARGVYIGLDSSFVTSPALLSFCWVIASAGAYLLEVITGDHTLGRDDE